MPTPCQMGLRDYITCPSYNPHSQIIPHSPTPWRPRFITTKPYSEHSMAGGEQETEPFPSRALLPICGFSLCSTRPARASVLAQKGQHPLPSIAPAHQARDVLLELGDGPAGRTAAQSGWPQLGVEAKSVGWHFSLPILIKIIEHCVGNPEQHPPCSVCRRNPSCVRVPTSHATPPLPPPDSALCQSQPMHHSTEVGVHKCRMCPVAGVTSWW